MKLTLDLAEMPFQIQLQQMGDIFGACRLVNLYHRTALWSLNLWRGIGKVVKFSNKNFKQTVFVKFFLQKSLHSETALTAVQFSVLLLP